jgi:hypothetical protein
MVCVRPTSGGTVAGWSDRACGSEYLQAIRWQGWSDRACGSEYLRAEIGSTHRFVRDGSWLVRILLLSVRETERRI